MNNALDFLKSDVESPKAFEAKILRHPSASNPDGPEPPLVFVTAFRTKSSSTSSQFVNYRIHQFHNTSDILLQDV